MADTRRVHSPKRVCAPLLSLLRWGRWRGARMCTRPKTLRRRASSVCRRQRGGLYGFAVRTATRRQREVEVAPHEARAACDVFSLLHAVCAVWRRTTLWARPARQAVGRSFLRVAGASCAGRLPGEKPKQAACSARSARARPSSTMAARARRAGAALLRSKQQPYHAHPAGGVGDRGGLERGESTNASATGDSACSTGQVTEGGGVGGHTMKLTPAQARSFARFYREVWAY